MEDLAVIKIGNKEDKIAAGGGLGEGHQLKHKGDCIYALCLLFI